MMLADYHVHTEFSDDSVYFMEDVIEDTIKSALDLNCDIGYIAAGILFLFVQCFLI